MTLVSGDIRFMQIFAEVPWGEGVKWQWGCRQWQFSAFSLAICSETFEVRPALLYCDTQSIVSFSVISKHVTLSGDVVLNSVFVPVWLAQTVRLSKNNCVETNKDRHVLSVAQIFRDSSFWQYKVCADIRSGSLETRRERTVGLRVNARCEHLFLAFENNCVKLNTDRPT